MCEYVCSMSTGDVYDYWELVDKYDNHHLMTVSKISYEFHEQNTVFNYECQDSFNYQLSRQNAGYEIINNPNDADFIGAKSLD